MQSPYPNGWFLLGFSDELAVGSELTVPAFGGEFHLSRDDAGVPQINAAPGEAPLALEEHSGLLLARRGSLAADLDFQIPELPEYAAPDWLGWFHKRVVVKTQAREVIENIADYAHFLPVHHSKPDFFEVELDGHLATQRSVSRSSDMEGRPFRIRTIATYHGPAIQFSRMTSPQTEIIPPSLLLNAHVPIDEEHIELRFGMLVASFGDEEATRKHADRYVSWIQQGYFEDVAIWEHKRWRDRPVLCDGDGPFMQVRRWYRQFYGDTVPVAPFRWTVGAEHGQEATGHCPSCTYRLAR